MSQVVCNGTLGSVIVLMNPISIKKIAGEGSEDDSINKKILGVY